MWNTAKEEEVTLLYLFDYRFDNYVLFVLYKSSWPDILNKKTFSIYYK